MRITELEAINRMLLGIRMAPVTTLDALDSYTEGSIARGILQQETLRVLSPGWNFNTRRLNLKPTTAGTIVPPANTIDVFTPQGQGTYGITAGGLLEDLENDTTKFKSAVDVFVVRGYAWDDLPPVIQVLVLDVARLAFKLEMRSAAGPTDTNLQETIVRSEAAAKAWDLRQQRRSMLDSLGLRRFTNARRGTPVNFGGLV